MTQCCHFCRVNTRDRFDMEMPATGDKTAGDALPTATAGDALPMATGLAVSEPVGEEKGSETVDEAPSSLPDLMLMAADGGLAGT